MIVDFKPKPGQISGFFLVSAEAHRELQFHLHRGTETGPSAVKGRDVSKYPTFNFLYLKNR